MIGSQETAFYVAVVRTTTLYRARGTEQGGSIAEALPRLAAPSQVSLAAASPPISPRSLYELYREPYT
jgi:hypothetical protein